MKSKPLHLHYKYKHRSNKTIQNMRITTTKHKAQPADPKFETAKAIQRKLYTTKKNSNIS